MGLTFKAKLINYTHKDTIFAIIETIDLIAINELDSVADIIEIKRKASNINQGKLIDKSVHLCNVISEIKSYKINTFGLSMEDI